MYHRLNIAQYRVYDMYRVYVWCIKVYKLCINNWIWPKNHVYDMCRVYVWCIKVYPPCIIDWIFPNTAYTTCTGCMSDVQKCTSYVSPVEYGSIPCIRHLQGVCLMYKYVKAMYQWLNMAQYRVYDMYRVYVWCTKVCRPCITGWIWPNKMYTTCTGWMSDV